MNKKVQLELTEAHLKAATKALEGFSRLWVGQRGIVKEIVATVSKEEDRLIWELKKVIDQYLAYRKSGGWHDISQVSFDGPLNPGPETPKFLGWEPRSFFPVENSSAQTKLKSLRLFNGGSLAQMDRFPLAWDIIKREAPEIPRGENWTLGESPDGEGTVGVWVFKPRKKLDA
jgi:hypothetical protein